MSDFLFSEIRIEATHKNHPPCTLKLDDNNCTYTVILDRPTIAAKEILELHKSISGCIRSINDKFNLDLTLYNM